MSKEILAIPEESLGEVIYVIRAGLDSVLVLGNFDKVSHEVHKTLEKWCAEEERYLNELG